MVKAWRYSRISGTLKNIMRQILAVTILLAVAGFAGWGFFVMSHEGAHGHHGCVAASALGTTCPDAGDIVGFLGFHIGAFKSFSNAVFTVFSLIAFTASLHIFAYAKNCRLARASRTHRYRGCINITDAPSGGVGYIIWL